MEILIGLVLTTITLLIAIVIATITVNITSWGYYRRIYKELDSYTFFVNDTQLYTSDLLYSDKQFIWFCENNEGKLYQNHYLINSFSTYLDPYSLYWLKKYQRYFAKLDPSRIKKYTGKR